MEDTLVDRIYECAFVPELWPEVLGALSDLAAARAGFLFVSRGDIHHLASSTSAGREALMPLVTSGWVARSERFVRFMNVRHAGFVTDFNLYTTEEMQADPFYRDILYPRGLGWAAGTVVRLPTDDVFAISLEREHARGPVEPAALDTLDTFRPHLARAALMSARLQMERARDVSQTLALVGLPALVFDPGGKVLAANSLIEDGAGVVVWKARDRVSLKDAGADALFRQALETIGRDDRAAPRSFAVRASGDGAAVVAHVIPTRRNARDVFLRCAGVLILSPVTLPEAPPVELVQSLFDLTPAEARVARSLTAGQTVEQIATNSGVSLTTVRTQVRGVLEKMGCRRQVDAIALLGGLIPAPARLPAARH